MFGKSPTKRCLPLPHPRKWNGMSGGGTAGGEEYRRTQRKQRRGEARGAMPCLNNGLFVPSPGRPNPETMRRDGLIQADTQRQMRFRAWGEWLTCFPPSAWQVGRASVPGCLKGALSLAPTFLTSPGAPCEGPERVHLGSRAWDERCNSPFSLELPAHQPLWLPPIPLWHGSRFPSPGWLCQRGRALPPCVRFYPESPSRPKAFFLMSLTD